jgi:hypothetical protein
MDKEIRAAIAQKRLLQFMYEGKLRIAEPHDYGIHKGSVKVFCYQVGGQSSKPLPNWRLFFLLKVSRLAATSEPFSGSRAVAGNISNGRFFLHQFRGLPFVAAVKAKSPILGRGRAFCLKMVWR